jgi:outer membrane biosynthesis protein TonB
MRAAKIVRRSLGIWTVVAVGVLLLAATARADRPALPAEEEAAVKRAIESGVKNLKKAQPSSGSWSPPDDPHAAGYAALPALALMECGVPKNDPVLLKAEAFVRKSLLTLDDTYDICLSILFLDRLGKKEDEQVIQGLAIRLIAGQSATGGWGYKCPKPTPLEVREILKVLHQITPKPQPPKPEGAPADSAPPELPPLGPLPILVPQGLSGLTIMQDLSKLELKDPPADKETPLVYIHTDNSVTQFALVALWTAQRHDVPLDRTLRLIANRFQTSQGEDGSWGYPYVFGGVGAGEGPPMDCCGLLGLAVGHGVAHGAHETVNAVQDKKIINGFAALNKFVGAPAGKTKDIASPNYYFLWSLERVGVLYDLPTIAGKDWYQWGAEAIVANQSEDGIWGKEGGYPGATPVANTSLALLFLARTNLVADLTASLRMNPDDLTKAIAAKVVTPPPAPPTPEPPPIVTPPKAPEPPPVVKDPPTPVVTPPAPPPAPAPAPKAEEKSTAWIWWVALVVVLVLGLVAASGLRLFFYLRNRKEAEKERKKEAKRKKEGKIGGKPASPEASTATKTKAPMTNGSASVKSAPPKKGPPGAASSVKTSPGKKGPST